MNRVNYNQGNHINALAGADRSPKPWPGFSATVNRVNYNQGNHINAFAGADLSPKPWPGGA